MNFDYVKLENFTDKSANIDVIINTVPALIFDEGRLERFNRNSILIDLASAPYGVSDKLAEKYNYNTNGVKFNDLY